MKNGIYHVLMYKNGNVFLIPFDFGSLRETPINNGLPLQCNVQNVPNEQLFIY